MENVFRRHQGPKVFISYSFGNHLANSVAEILGTRGYQVTVVHDKMLLGTPSLRGALTDLIQQSELVIPVLDLHANKSAWVEVEVSIAESLNKPLIPIVQDDSGVSPAIAGIAYLNERSNTLSVENSTALLATMEAFYCCVPLEQHSPFHFDERALLNFIVGQQSSQPMIRPIIDPYGVYEAASSAMEEFQAQTVDESGRKLYASVGENITLAMRSIDRLQEIMCNYREAIHLVLGSYGADLPQRCITSWQRALRRVVGSPWIDIGGRFPQEWLSEVLPDYSSALTQAVAESRVYEGDNSVCNDKVFTWAMQFRTQTKGPYNPSPGKGGWFWCGFATDFGRSFVGFLPANQRIIDGTKYAQRPSTYVEDYEWADYGLPQLVARGIMLANRFGDGTLVSELVYDLRQYNRSYYPS